MRAEGAYFGRYEFIVRARFAPALNVAEHGGTALHTRLLRNDARKPFGNGCPSARGEIVALFLLAHRRLAGAGSALGNGDYNRARARRLFIGYELCKFIFVVDDFGNEYGIGARGYARIERQPAHLVAHHLHEEHAAVTFGRGAYALYGARRYIHRRMEAERYVGAVDIVINRLGEANYVTPLDREKGSRLVRARPAQRYKAVELQFFVVFHHHLQSGGLVALLDRHQLERLAGCAEYCAAEVEYIFDVGRGKTAVIFVHKPRIAFEEAVNFDVLYLVEGVFAEPAQHSVEPGAVAPARKYANPHFFLRARTRALTDKFLFIYGHRHYTTNFLFVQIKTQILKV